MSRKLSLSLALIMAVAGPLAAAAAPETVTYGFDFERPDELSQWTLLWGSREGDLVPSSTEKPPDATGSVAVETAGAYQGQQCLRLTGGGVALRSDYLPYAGQAIYLGAAGKMAADSVGPWNWGTVVCQVYFCDENRQSLGHMDFNYILKGQTEWKYVESGPAFVPRYTKYLYVVVMAVNGQQGTAWVDNVQVRLEPLGVASKPEDRRRSEVAVDATQPGEPVRGLTEGMDIYAGWTLGDPHMLRAATRAQSFGFRYLRAHDVIGGACKQLDAAGKPILDAGRLDSECDNTLSVGMKPMIILESIPHPLSATPPNPGEEWHNLGPVRDYALWEDLIAQIVKHLEDRYGREEVRTWRFEMWNEPETGGSGYRGNFNELYDHTVAGVDRVDPEVYLGGSGSGGPTSELFDKWLEHCATGTNYATGERGTRVDFISFHFYLGIGVPAWNSGVWSLSRGLEQIRRYDKYDHTPLIISEWNGIMDLYHECHTGYNAALTVHCLRLFADQGIDEAYAFSLAPYVPNPGPETNLVFFDSNNYFGPLGLPYPAANTFRLASKLRGSGLPVEVATEPVTGLAALTEDGKTVRVLLGNWVEDPQADFTTRVRLRVRGPESFRGKAPELRVWRVSTSLGSAWDEWQAMGSPPQPTEQQLNQLLAATDIPLTEQRTLQPGEAQEVTLELPVHSVALVELDVGP